MDVARELLNNLMGRDRNKPKGDTSGRDHYSNRDVCKPYLICFCFNTLFPNTVYDEGPCNKRHDTYLKNMFDNDLARKDYERQYIKQCISTYWIQKRLTDVDQKIKKNLSVIETKTTFTGDRPKQILNRIIAIDADIQNMMKQAQIFGQNGQIDESARCLEQAERLRERRRQIQSMNDTTNTIQKQQKICQICGAIQTINDTQKRIQTHLEGKIHQGFLKLRHQLETLKIRLEIIHQMDPNRKEKQNQRQKEKENIKEKQRQREKQKQREREKQKQRERQRQRQKQKDKQRDRERQHRDRDRQKDKQRNRQTQKHGQQISKHKNHEMNDEKNQRSHSQKKKKEKDRQRSRQRKHKKQKDDKYRERDYDMDRERDRKQKKKHKKQRSKSRSRDKYLQRFQRQRKDYER